MLSQEYRKKFTECTKYVDYDNSAIQEIVREMFTDSMDDVDKVKVAYAFVRDEIPHSFDIHADTVNAKASDVLKNRTGICHAKANLLAALLRSQKIPTGFCFQHLTLADDESLGYCIHGYNAVYLQEHWIKLDARGNKPGVNAQFSLTKPILAFPLRKQFNEYNINGIFAHPREKSMEVLEKSRTLDDVMEFCTDEVIDIPDIYEIDVRPFEPTDIEMFTKWLYLPHVAKFYHDPLEWIDEVKRGKIDFSWINQMIVEYCGKPIGFCQYYSFEKSIEYGEDWNGTIPVINTYSVDYIIADTDYLGKGYGRQIVLELIDLICMEEKAERIIVKPEKGNAPSCNTLLASGFVYDSENELYIMYLDSNT